MEMSRRARSMEMELLGIALRNPTEIGVLRKLLDRASRTACVAATTVQKWTRIWIARRQAASFIQLAARRRHRIVCCASGRIVRAWRRHARKGLEHRAACIITRRMRRLCLTLQQLRCVHMLVLLASEAFNLGASTTQWESSDSSYDPLQETAAMAWQVDDQLSRIAGLLWTFAEQNKLLRTEDYSMTDVFDRCTGSMLNDYGARLVLALMDASIVDLDTRLVCHCLMHGYIWSIVESNGNTKCGLTDEELEHVQDLCTRNLFARNWDVFRGALHVLSELRHLKKLRLSAATLQHLLGLLRPGSRCGRESLASPLSTRRGTVLFWGTSVVFEIMHVLAACESWNALFEAGYLKSVLMIWSGLTDADDRAQCVVANVWDEWPTEEICFQSTLRSAVRSLITSENLIERYSFSELVILFILRGIQLQSTPFGKGAKLQAYSRSDQGDRIACACLGKLLVEAFCSGHESRVYCEGAVKTFLAEFATESFREDVIIWREGNPDTEWCGALVGQEALLSLLDHSQIPVNLRADSREANQLIALYTLRGLSFHQLLAVVTVDEYISALHRHPTALFGAWFEKDAASHPQLNVRLAHCAAATGQTTCLRACGGDLPGWSVTCQLDQLQTADGSNLLHTAASHGSTESIKFLLRKGFSAASRNRKGDSPLSLASRASQKACVTLLEGAIRKRTVEEQVADIESDAERPSKQPFRKSTNPINVTLFVSDRPAAGSRVEQSSCNAVDASQAVPAGQGSPDPLKVCQDRKAAMRTLKAHSQIPEHLQLIKIIASEFEGDVGVLSLEQTAGTLHELLPMIHKSKVDNRLDLCLQLLTGLQVVHTAGRCHLGIEPGNIFFAGAKPDFFVLKLGLVGQAGVPTFSPPTDSTEHLTLAQLAATDIFACACVISLLVSGHHLFGMDAQEQLQNISTGTMTNISLLKRTSYEAYDLVQSMVLKQLTVNECIAHPLFWPAKDRFLYVSELVRTERHLLLPSGEMLGLPADWRRHMQSSGLLYAYMVAKVEHSEREQLRYGSQPKELLRLLRNFYQHPPRSEGGNPLAEAAEELKRFRELFASLHVIFGPLPYSCT